MLLPVSSCPESGYGNQSLQRDRDLDGLCDQVFDFSEHGEVVLGLDVFWIGDHHSGNKTTKGCDTVSLSDTELHVSCGQKAERRPTTEVSTWVAPASRAA